LLLRAGAAPPNLDELNAGEQAVFVPVAPRFEDAFIEALGGVHSHYADAGYVGRQLSMLLGIPQIHTGHSLGKPKQEKLLSSGRKATNIEKQFNFERRIAEEEALIQHASMIVTSTRQEVELQYGMYAQPDTKKIQSYPARHRHFALFTTRQAADCRQRRAKHRTLFRAS